MQNPIPREFVTPEFSRPYLISELPPEGASVALEASETEREALARRFGIEGIGRLTARLALTRDARAKQVTVRGSFDAEVTQSCVVTLEPFESVVAEHFVARFVRDAATAQATEVFIDLTEEEEPPEPITGDSVDLGEVVAQYLALTIDPYPRRPGVKFEQGKAGVPAEGEEAEKTRSPFAALSVLRSGKGS
jgi:uncharacterized metal-binding protein YceD (DUF177 family)